MNRRGRPEVVWSPTPVDVESARVTEFARFVDRPADHEALLAWSLADPAAFWSGLAAWAGVRWHDRPAATMVGNDVARTSWFPGATLNFAERALSATGEREVIVAHSQTREPMVVTADELRVAVAACRAGLRRLGVGRGDRVVAFLPNVPEAVVAFLATASLGAIWSSCAPEFGVRAVVDRWQQLAPAVLFAVGGYQYGGRRHDRCREVTEIVAALPSVRHVVEVPYPHHALGSVRDAVAWSSLGADADEALVVDPVPFDHPLQVLFSSGTTGLPKPIVHGHGGILLEHIKVLALHHDLGPGDRFSWYSTTGWMMWNYLVSGLLVGSAIVLFDGDPAHPDLSTLWRLAQDEHLDVLGVSAPFVMACAKAGLTPGRDFDLGGLRQLGSTGAPLPADGFRWIRDHVGRHVQPASISGGTDVCTAFVGSSPTTAVRAGEISGRLLGCDVRAVAPDGSDCPPGVTGELVLAAALPSMPVGLWGDVGGDRLRATYFERFPGRWHHGDWITFHDDGACVISGRSDATLNRGGVRLGTADLYAVVEARPEVLDSLAVHLEDPEGGPGTLVLLIVCAAGHELTAELRAAIVGALRTELSPRHVPDEIHAVRAIPRTLSGKKLEIPAKRVLLGESADHVASRGSLADPTALDDLASLVRSRV